MQLCQKNIKYKQYLHCIKNILCRFSELANGWQFLKYIKVNQKSLEKKKTCWVLWKHVRELPGNIFLFDLNPEF